MVSIEQVAERGPGARVRSARIPGFCSVCLGAEFSGGKVLNVTGPGLSAEELTLSERIQRIFLAPRLAFEAIRGRETANDWLMPVLLVCLVGLAAHYLTLDVLTDLEAPAVQQALETMDEAERKGYEENAAMMRDVGWMMIPVGVFTSLVLVGWVLLALGRSLFQAEVTFRQVLVIKAYAGMAVAVEWLLRAILVLLTGDPGADLGPGAFLPDGLATSFGGRVILGLNPFDLWQIGIMGVGLSTMAGVSTRKATIALLVLWLLWLMGGAALQIASQNLASSPLPQE